MTKSQGTVGFSFGTAVYNGRLNTLHEATCRRLLLLSIEFVTIVCPSYSIHASQIFMLYMQIVAHYSGVKAEYTSGSVHPTRRVLRLSPTAFRMAVA